MGQSAVVTTMSERVLDMVASRLPRALIPVPEIVQGLGLPLHDAINLICEAENKGVICTWELDGDWYCILSEIEAESRKIELVSSVSETTSPKQWRWTFRAWIPLRSDRKEAEHRNEAKRKKKAESEGEARSKKEAESRGHGGSRSSPDVLDYRDVVKWKSVSCGPTKSPLLARVAPGYSTGWKLVGLCRPGWALDCEPDRKRRQCIVCGDRQLAKREYCLGCCVDGDRPKRGVQRGLKTWVQI